MDNRSQLQIELTPYGKGPIGPAYDLDRILYDLDSEVSLLASRADTLDYLLSIASGVLCGAIDILWVGEFRLERGRDFASGQVDAFVQKTAKLLGCKSDDLQSAVKFLEKKFPIPSDGNTPDFGGGLQHHLRDFAHHPTIVGLIFSLLTQFTCKSYGTDVKGRFIVAEVPEKSKSFIGKDVPQKLLFGTVTWFFHLVSDMAGSGSTAGKSGGTGIPGPLLSLVKELSVLPFFREIAIHETSLSVFLSKLFNGTLLAKRDADGRIIKDTLLRFDLRGELGAGAELSRQAVPVAANECIVRAFYFIRHLAVEIRANDIRTIDGLKQIEWDRVKPAGNPAIDRMLLIAAGVFTTIDVGEAVLTQKYWLSVNYAGVGRFAIAVGEDVAWCLKARNVKKVRQMYADMKHFVYAQQDERIYERIGRDMDMDKLGLTVAQTEILYNLEYYKTLHDINLTTLPVGGERIRRLKQEWLEEWKQYMTAGFSSFLQLSGAELHWYTMEELFRMIEENEPKGPWFRLVLLETMLFEPYYPLSLEKDKKGHDVPCRKYKELQNGVLGYRRDDGDRYLDILFSNRQYYPTGYLKRLRKCHNKVLLELNEVLKAVLSAVVIGSAVLIAAVATAGAFAPSIAVILVGSNFTGLSGAALTNACLAYLGGGAVAAGGAGMAGGTMAIVGGGAMLGLGAGAGVGGAVGAASLMGKKNAVLQSAKLLVSIREIFLNDEKDTAYSDSIYEQYVQNIMEIEKGIVELKLQADVADRKTKDKLKARIKAAEEYTEVMKLARKSMAKFTGAFKEGLMKSTCADS